MDGQQAFHSFFVYNTAFVKFKKDLLCVHLLKAFMRSLAKIKNTLFFVPWAHVFWHGQSCRPRNDSDFSMLLMGAR